MNYSVDHNLLTDPIFEKLKGSKKTTTLIVLSAIRHFTKHIGFMDLYSRQFAEDIGVHRNTLSNVLKMLVEKKYIKVIKAYQRQGNIPNRYVSLKVVHGRQKVVHTDTGGGTPGYTVNNSNKNYKQNEVGSTKPTPSLIEGSKEWWAQFDKVVKQNGNN